MTAAAGTVLILGSGTSTGVPVIGCDCPVCRSRDAGNQRTRCSALVSCNGYQLLIDTSTDLRQQALRENLRRIDAVLYTHTHADHVHGIDELRIFNLRVREPIPIYGAPAVLDSLRRNFGYIFAAEDGGGFRPRLRLEAFTGPFQVHGIPIVPLLLGHGPGEAYGYRIGDLAYLTDCDRIPVETLRLLGGIRTLIIDALRFHPHDSHFTVTQAIAVARQLSVPRTVLTHLSHDIDFTRHGSQLPDGIELAFDGQCLPFDCHLP